MSMQAAQQTFIEESRELLRDMEAALLTLEKTPDDADSVNAVFRAAHTIKGSAGVFGFDALVGFTHVMENVLDDIRAGRVHVDADLIALLLACGDHVSLLLDCLGDAEVTAAAGQESSELQAQLNCYLEAGAAGLPQVTDDLAHDEQVHRIGGDTVASDTWHISVRFGRDVLRHGMDPLSFIRYLATLGEIQSISTLFDVMPEAEAMDPESCYLGVEIDFTGAVDKATIEGAFEYVRDVSAIRILPPHSKITDYINLINDLPEDKASLGDLLVASGVLTQHELDEGLRVQREQDRQAGMDANDPLMHTQKIGTILVDQGMVQSELVNAAIGKQDQIKQHKAQEASNIRVHAGKLDELINLVGELVIASASVGLSAQRAGNAELTETASTLARLVEEVRDSALNLRMVPIGETFNRFNRVVRDLGRELGKDIELVLSGGDTELDKTMVEKINDPLMHLVRNALDHGIEAPAVRAQRGKPPRGRLRLNAYHETGSIVIEVADDGGGLDRERILARAIERGLAAADQQLTDQQVYQFILEAGFSTAQTITNVSGRGIGMDVVKRNIEALRGSINIESEAGVGTTMVMRLPLTLAIIDGFLVGVGKSAYVVPLEMVFECIELSAQDRTRVRESGYINLRGEVLPLLRLRDVFEVRGEPGKRENIVVVQYAGMQAGFVVDALMGEFQTVIKPLGKLFERLSGISGSTILGTGDVALILDVPALVQKAVGSETGAGLRAAGNTKLLERH
jgi:two-component system, chemotaxis family, sensor kinase CheA